MEKYLSITRQMRPHFADLLKDCPNFFHRITEREKSRRAFLVTEAADEVKLCESPIEFRLLDALLALPSAEILFEEKTPRFFGKAFFVRSQVPFNEYRIDFSVEHGAETILVECDGHDFHERTKDQAKRDRKKDRAVQVSGRKILRFTGSEIFQDAAGCAEAIKKAFNCDCYLCEVKRA